jgi:hypothetical protein
VCHSSYVGCSRGRGVVFSTTWPGSLNRAAKARGRQLSDWSPVSGNSSSEATRANFGACVSPPFARDVKEDEPRQASYPTVPPQSIDPPGSSLASFTKERSPLPPTLLNPTLHLPQPFNSSYHPRASGLVTIHPTRQPTPHQDPATTAKGSKEHLAYPRLPDHEFSHPARLHSDAMRCSYALRALSRT